MVRFKSVFFKFIATFLLVNILAYTILSATVSIIVNNYGSDVKENTLKNACESISLYLKGDYTSFRKYVFDEATELKRVMRLLSINDDGMLVYITDVDGMVILFGGADTIGISSEANSNGNGRYNLLEFQPNLEDTLVDNGKISGKGNLNGFFKFDHVYYGIPFVDSQNNYQGAIFAISSNPDIDALALRMINTILIAAIWIMVISLIVIYFLLNRFLKPIREMSQAAKAFAGGQLDARVKVKGNDEIAELSSAFNNMADSMQSLENMRRSFLANVSHDLRTPMTTISGFIDGILSGAINKEDEEHYLGIIQSEVQRLSRLVSQILDISKLEAGERKFTPEVFDICEQGREIIISNIQRLEDKNLNVVFECDDDNIYVVADKDAIYQIFYNICDNAIKFAYPSSEYLINISVINGHVEVSVFNEGKGIPAEDQPFIFERFYKSDKSRGRDKTGVGLGMYIARTIIEAQGQKIWLESVEDKYCKFTFTLELADKK